MNKFRNLILVCTLLALLAPAAARADDPLARFNLQSPVVRRDLYVRWSVPQHVPGYDDMAEAPYLVADQNRTVHAFNSVVSGNRLVVVYSQWNATTGWTNPVDILISPLKLQARIRGAFLDDAGIVHVIFFGGDDLGASIFYSSAPLIDAGRASAWEPVRDVGDTAITPTDAALAGDGQGNLVMVYHGNREGVGLYAAYSSDGGRGWTDPTPLFLPPAGLDGQPTHWPVALRMARDDQGHIHLVWTLVNVQGNGDAVMYSRFSIEERLWSNPFVLATRDPGDYEADWGSIVYHAGRLIVVYDDSLPATRWMRISDDLGQNWSDPILPFNYIGEYRHAAFAVDSANNLHMLLGNRTTANTHGMWHTVWLGTRWSDLQPVVAGPRVVTGPLLQHFDPTGPQAIVVQGNLLLVTWWTDPGAGRNGVWSAYTYLNTPELPVIPLVAPEPEPTRTPAPLPGGSEQTVAQELRKMQGVVPVEVNDPPNPVIIVIAAIIPTAILLVAVGYVYRSRRGGRSRRRF